VGKLQEWSTATPVISLQYNRLLINAASPLSGRDMKWNLVYVWVIIVPPKFVKPKYNSFSVTFSIIQCPGVVASPAAGVAGCLKVF
jgi:hypothetical protein